jgi:lysophospholipase L1-like esterase
VLDCLPNLVGQTEIIRSRLAGAVKILQQKRPGVPILIVDHADANVASLNKTQYEKYNKTNEASRETFERLKAEGIRNIFYLTADSIGLGDEHLAIDGVHPNAGGMELYAGAYARAIRRILHEPSGQYTTMQPCKQFRDRSYDWNARHRSLLKANKDSPPGIVLLGNSIVQHWGGKSDKTIHRGEDSWGKYFAPHGVRNFGFGGDRIENVLWRVYHGALDGYKARQVIIMIGTNNLDVNSDREIVAGLKQLLQAVKERQTSAKMLMVGILPRSGPERRIAGLNKQIAWMCSKENIPYINPGILLLDTSGKVKDSLFARGPHPGAEGYRILAKAMAPYLAP